MMTERQKKFREKYFNEISPFYNGLVHIGVMYTVGISLIYYCVSNLHDVTWEWMVILPVAIAGNFVEWAMHKYVMHRLIDVFALRAIYDRHTRQHHQYFTDTDYTIDTVKEFRIVFFPWRVLTVLGVFGTFLGYVASQIFNPNVGYFVFMTMVGHYLIYETFHYCCHIKENWFVRNMPFINTIRRHHAAHHNLGIMMHKNMNLSFPLADWVMGTSDLKRGLLGTLLNGFNQAHIDPDLKPIIEKFKNGKIQEEKVTLEGPILTSEEAKALEK
ncbi:fatty acid hydroxylase family protein [Polynucleobacter sp. AP-Sanab-80-C2]|uniref:fatty acid hydroxylase family protein n=1 Tax=Polynucleobacter sp. AP-Sanab-80-C2 TaxID=3108274 RepID=UPI002B23AF99|nr:fatty acid hydroxylase family protein [Polynucleobacter sp. AP-Sanab-80-C2]MEA9600456.1 fatty acid hydroxylase family protein [Polynucleobacter sp. AP-Sanab-80-C2]